MKTAILRAALFTPTRKGWGLPMLAWGDPGVAKSSVIEELCATVGLPCVTLSPGAMGEGAFGVVPVPDKIGVIRYPAPEWTLHVAEGGVVFVDELVDCPAGVAPALQGLLLDGVIGGKKLHRRVRRLAAANDPEIATSGQDISVPNANRVGHIQWGAPSNEAHTAYMLRGSTGDMSETVATVNATDEEARVMAAWPDAWARAVALETTFLGATNMKNKCPKGEPGATRAWPSDRSWENATRALAAAAVHKLSESETEEFVAAFIGHAAASTWFSYIEKQDLPNAGDLLDGRAQFTHERSRIDRTAAVLNACVSLVSPKDAAKREARSNALWTLIHKLFDERTCNDILVGPTQSLIESGLHTGKQAVLCLAKIQPMLRAADIRPGQR